MYTPACPSLTQYIKMEYKGVHIKWICFPGGSTTMYDLMAKISPKENQLFWFPTRSDTNRGVQLLKQAISLKFRI